MRGGNLQVAYVTSYDSTSVLPWSGLGYFISQALSNEAMTLRRIGPLHEKYALLFKCKQYLYRLLTGKGYLRTREPVILRDYARQVRAQLEAQGSNLVFSPGTVPIAYLDCEQPIAFWTDATFAGLVDFYPRYTNLCQETIANGNAMEQAALDRAALAIYSSEWAAQSALQHYRVEPSKIRVVPFGANLRGERTLEEVRRLIVARPAERCVLTFLGVDWTRKGGDKALAVAARLNKLGLPTELRVVGCQPPSDRALPEFVRRFGFISKASDDGSRRLEQLLGESHFLILPSRAECAAVALAEANALGVPCLATAVGGTATVVRDDINGRTFALDADAGEYCEYVMTLFGDCSRYKHLALASREEYQNRLNWSVASRRVLSMLEEIV